MVIVDDNYSFRFVWWLVYFITILHLRAGTGLINLTKPCIGSIVCLMYNNRPAHARDTSENVLANRNHPLKNAVVGASLLCAAGAGIVYSTQDESFITERLKITTDQAQPSDLLANTFDGLERISALAGGLVLAKRGAHHLKSARNPASGALDTMAHASSRRRVLRITSAATLLTAGAGVMAGNYFDAADSVSRSQANVGNFLVDIVNEGENTVLITNTPRPELANNATINPDVAAAVIEAATQSGETIIPMHWEWHPAVRPANPEAKIQVLAAGLPQEITGLPLADEKCQDVSVAAAKELGIGIGQEFQMDGLTLKVRAILNDSAGFNLLPVILNNQDFERCVNTNAEQPYNVLLSGSGVAKAQEILNQAGVGTDDLSERVFVVPAENFVADTLQTGKNTVNGLVLQAMALGLIFGGVALSGRDSNELISNRENNRLLKVNGFNERHIAKMYAEKAEADTLQSSLFAVPGILLVDAFTNMGQPGAALGPSAKTYLCVLGLTWGVKRLGTSVAVRKERGLEETEPEA